MGGKIKNGTGDTVRMSALSETEILLEATRVYADSANALADRENDPRPMSLWNIHNRVKMAVEMLSYYSGFRVTPETEGELTERIVVVTKDLFVDVVSAIEKASKDAVRLYPGSETSRRAGETQRMNLRSIIDASLESGTLAKEDADEWSDILLIRNLVVHNNSVADRPMVSRVGNITVSMRPGRMMKGPQSTFVVLTSRAVTLFHTWLLALDSTS